MDQSIIKRNSNIKTKNYRKLSTTNHLTRKSISRQTSNFYNIDCGVIPHYLMPNSSSKTLKKSNFNLNLIHRQQKIHSIVDYNSESNNY